MLSFYEGDLGLNVIQSLEEHTVLATVGSSKPLIILHNQTKASKPPPDATGLYHYALLVPNRQSLAGAYLTLGGKGVGFEGYADHHVSEALYLSDPEGNGIEIYTDRPRSEWKFDEEGVDMTTQPLDLDSLIKEHSGSDEPNALVNGTIVGHMHLKVSDLQNSISFYRDALGFELMRYWGSAAFLSAGGYHHHIGMNTWESLGGPAARKTWTGLEYFALTISKANLYELSTRLTLTPVLQGNNSPSLFVSDPDDINLVFKVFDQRSARSTAGT